MNKNYISVSEYQGRVDILESKTNHIIKQQIDKRIASKLLNSLNGGGFFNGCTPDFFLIPFATKN